jgi:hypothetical protein
LSTPKFTSRPISIGADAAGPFQRADVVVEGLDQSGPSFEARVFLNNPEADERTEPLLDNGYIGSIHVYGYGLWPEDAEAEAPPEPKGIRAPMMRALPATEAVRAAVRRGKPVTVTVVSVPYGNDADALRFDPGAMRASITIDQPPSPGA